MNSKHSLKYNLVFNMAYQIMMLIVSLITAPYISRTLGVSGVGEYQFTYSVAHYFVLFSMLGVLNYGNREIAGAKENRKQLEACFWGIYSVQFLMGCICLSVYLAYVFLIPEGMHQTVSLVQSIYLIAGITDISWFCFGMEQFRFTTAIGAVVKMITTGLIFLLVKKESHVWLYAAVLAGGELINRSLLWIFLNRKLSFKPLFRGSWKKHIRPVLTLFIPVIAVSLYKFMDKIMLGIMVDTAEVGIYGSAERFIVLPMSVIAAVGTVMLPRITSLRVKDDSSGIRSCNHISMSFVLFLSIGMMFGLYGISSVFIPWFYGEAFARSASVLNVLLPSIVFVGWANVLRTQCLLPKRKDREYCISVIIGAVINLFVNMSCIPKLGASGAAVGTLAAEMIVCVVQSVLCRKDIDLKKCLGDGFPYLVSGIIMYLGINRISLPDTLVTIMSRIGIGVIIYFLLSSAFIWKSVKTYRGGRR